MENLINDKDSIRLRYEANVQKWYCYSIWPRKTRLGRERDHHLVEGWIFHRTTAMLFAYMLACHKGVGPRLRDSHRVQVAELLNRAWVTPVRAVTRRALVPLQKHGYVSCLYLQPFNTSSIAEQACLLEH